MKSFWALVEDFKEMWYSLDRKWQIAIVIFLIGVVLALLGLGLEMAGVEGTPYPLGEGG